ncbi:hypothetical protein [Psychroflexus lacisalsi]|jgi:hypothetical protein|uniref:Lipocalin-like domain-containing protein n=1 Tax=Psychroflexus lacisalsi TaxID=503928 RepID=A0ABN1K5J1_9FLAO|nr:hypothetical protein [Psychroflexus lacisalsi]MBZ9619135.1 hypothetical protein [Psychroflexus lacisalsi]
MLLSLVNCALESRYSLSNDEKINTELLGEWFVEGNNEEKLIVEKHGAKTYKLILKVSDKTDELISYSKTIEGYQVMNLQTEFEADIINVFYGFEINEKTFAFHEVDDALRNEEFKSKS